MDAGAGANIAAYYWSNGATTQTNTVTSAGMYHVTVTDVNGCVWHDSIQVTEAPIPTVNLGPDVTICQGQFTLLSAPLPIQLQLEHRADRSDHQRDQPRHLYRDRHSIRAPMLRC
ncbi:MAG: hypothetical protein U0176_10085 [Bacteroidia bacterium]